MRVTRLPQDRIARPWLWPNLIGLDAPTVAVCWQWIFATSFGIELPFTIHLVLGLSAWCIYLADRLVDVHRTKPDNLATERHRFTGKYSGRLTIVLALAAAVDLALIIRFVPPNLVFTGCATAALLGIYYLIRLGFAGKNGNLIPREILCGMLFALGTTIGPHAFTDDGLNEFRYFLAVFIFGLVCSINCILISIWEHQADLSANDSSFATSRSNLIPHVSTFLSCLVIISAALSFCGSSQPFLAITLAAIALRITLHFERHLSREMLRVISDGVLLTPLIFWLI